VECAVYSGTRHTVSRMTMRRDHHTQSSSSSSTCANQLIAFIQSLWCRVRVSASSFRNTFLRHSQSSRVLCQDQSSVGRYFQFIISAIVSYLVSCLILWEKLLSSVALTPVRSFIEVSHCVVNFFFFVYLKSVVVYTYIRWVSLSTSSNRMYHIFFNNVLQEPVVMANKWCLCLTMICDVSWENHSVMVWYDLCALFLVVAKLKPSCHCRRLGGAEGRPVALEVKVPPTSKRHKPQSNSMPSQSSQLIQHTVNTQQSRSLDSSTSAPLGKLQVSVCAMYH